MYVYCNFLLLTSKEKLFRPPLFWAGDATGVRFVYHHLDIFEHKFSFTKNVKLRFKDVLRNGPLSILSAHSIYTDWKSSFKFWTSSPSIEDFFTANDCVQVHTSLVRWGQSTPSKRIVHVYFESSVGCGTQCYYRELERNKNENDFNIVLPNEN